MTKVKIGKFEVDEAELHRKHREAVRRGEEKLDAEPQARSVSYDREANRLVIELKNGATLIVPTNLIQGLRDADPNLIAQVELLPRGAALHWETLDQDFSIMGLMAGIFGNRVWMRELGRKGGSVRSEAKAAAVRANGKKGGRPSVASRKRREA